MFARIIPAVATFFFALGCLLVAPLLLGDPQVATAAAPAQELEILDPYAIPEALRTFTIELKMVDHTTPDDGVVTYLAIARNDTDRAITALQVDSSLPADSTLVPTPDSFFTYDYFTAQLVWQVGTLPANSVLTTTFRIQPGTTDSQLVAQLTATSPDLKQPQIDWLVTDYGNPPDNTAWITPEGGQLQADFNTLHVDVAADTFARPVQVSVTPYQSRLKSPLLTAFSLAVSPAENAAKSLLRPLTVGADVSAFLPLPQGAYGSLGFYRLDETQGVWRPVASHINWNVGTLLGSIDRPGIYGVGFGADPSFGAQHIPALLGYSTNEFGGNSIYQYPMIMPPGPGNLGINLGLNYSSENVNAIFGGYQPRVGLLENITRQAGVVGWGWSLGGLGQITRDMNNGGMYLTFSGGSYELLFGGQDEDDGINIWYTKPESFLKITSRYSAGSGSFVVRGTEWSVTTQEGTTFIFGDTAWGQSSGAVAYNLERRDAPNEDECRRTFREAQLREVVDVNGNTIKITYNREYSETDFCDTYPSSDPNYVRAVYPSEIRYLPVSEVGAERETVRTTFKYSPRQDVEFEYTPTLPVHLYYATQRLMTVTMQVRNTDTVTMETNDEYYSTTHSYVLSQTYDWEVEPDKDGNGAGILLLDGVVMRGKNGTARTPTRFDYVKPDALSANFNVLRGVANNQGGSVAYEYAKHTNILIRGCDDPGGNRYTRRFRVTEMEVSSGFGDMVQHRYFITNTVAPTTITDTAFAVGYDYLTGCTQDFEFGGYNYVRHEVYDVDLTEPETPTYSLVQNTESRYYQNIGAALTLRKGLPLSIRVLSPVDGAPLQTITNTYTVVTDTWLLAQYPTDSLRFNWVRKDQSWQVIYGVGDTAAYTTGVVTNYFYDIAKQGGDQYGLVTEMATYNVALTGWPNRTQQTEYVITGTLDSTYTDTHFLIRSDQVTQTAPYTYTAALCVGHTFMEYDSLGRPVASHTAVNSCDEVLTDRITTRLGYDVYGNVITSTDANNQATLVGYDTHSTDGWPRLYTYPLTSTAPLTSTSLVTRYNWDKVLGQVLRMTDANGNVVDYLYDEYGRPTHQWQPGDGSANPATHRWFYEDYEDTEHPYTVLEYFRSDLGNTNPEEYTFSHTYYDGLGRVLETRQTYFESAAGSSQHTVVAMGYHPLGGVEIAYAPVATTALTTFIPLEHAIWTSAPRTTTTYDGLGRVLDVTAPDGTVTGTRYGVVAYGGQAYLWQDIKDGNQHRLQQRLDGFGRLAYVVEFEGNCGDWTGAVADEVACGLADVEWSPYATTTYGYNSKDQLVLVTDDASNSSTMSYDLTGRKLSMNDPDMGIWEYRYDPGGNLTRQLDAEDNGICFVYDALNRLTQKRVFTGVAGSIDSLNCNGSTDYTVNYGYDAGANGKGLRTSLSDPSGATAWSYDERGRLASETKTILHASTPYTFTTAYTYDTMDRLRTMTYPGDSIGGTGETVTYQYSDSYQSNLSAVVGTDLYVIGRSYNPYGQLVAQGFATSNSLEQTYQYYPLTTPNGQGRLASMTLTGPDSPPFAPLNSFWQELLYDYDAVGNVVHITDTIASQVQTYTYDDRDRLASAVVSGGGLPLENYSYDTIGNLTVRGTDVYTYGAELECGGTEAGPHAATGFGVMNYCYNNVGNMTLRTDTAEELTATMGYDGENRLVVFEGGVNAEYTYDGDGNRVKSVIDGQVVLYVGNYLEYAPNDFNGLSQYYYAGTQRIGMRQGGGVSFLVGDHLGSTSLTVDADGEIVGERRYGPWGSTRYSDGITPTRRQYTGQVNDVGTGLYFYGARYYDPALARFIQADTIVPGAGNPQSLNRYSYVNNNPLRYTDPTGHWSQSQLDEHLGENWEDVYFGNGGVFEGQDWLIDALLSNAFTDEYILQYIVAPVFKGLRDSHQLGDLPELATLDALGVRIEGSITFKKIVGINFEADFIFNFKAKQFSIFIVPAVGIGFPSGRSVTVGFIAIRHLDSNKEFRGPGYSIGILGGLLGGGYGANGEGFFGALNDTYNPFDVPHGFSIGGGKAWDASVLATFGYAGEWLRIDYSSGQWQTTVRPFDGSQPWPNVAAEEMWNAFMHDIWNNPYAPW